MKLIIIANFTASTLQPRILHHHSFWFSLLPHAHAICYESLQHMKQTIKIHPPLWTPSNVMYSGDCKPKKNCSLYNLITYMCLCVLNSRQISIEKIRAFCRNVFCRWDLPTSYESADSWSFGSHISEPLKFLIML